MFKHLHTTSLPIITNDPCLSAPQLLQLALYKHTKEKIKRRNGYYRFSAELNRLVCVDATIADN